MRHAPVLLLLLASTGAVAADPPKPDCPAPQAETVHLYLKTNGGERPDPKRDGTCASWTASETARGPRDGKDCTGPRGGHPASSAVAATDGACITSSSADSSRTPMGGKDCTGPRDRPGTAAGASSRTAHAINSKGTGATGRAAAGCPAPASSTAPAK